MQALHSIIDVHEDILVLKYEDMLERTENRPKRISGFTDRPLTAKLQGDPGDRPDFSDDMEDSRADTRQPTPGDRRRKLQRDTIARMTGGCAASRDSSATRRDPAGLARRCQSA